jgi:hypothetical protein
MLLAVPAYATSSARSLSFRLKEISSAGTTNVNVPPGRWIVDANLTIPSLNSVSLKLGAQIEIKKGCSLRIDGNFTAPNQSIFAGSGTVAFGNLPKRVVNPKWWGAKGDGISDDTQAIQAAINSITQGKVLLEDGIYLISPRQTIPDISFITIKPNITLAGKAIGRSVLKVKDRAGPYHFIIAAPSKPYDCSNFHLENLTIDSNIANNAIKDEKEIMKYYRCSIALYNSNNVIIDTVDFRNESSINTISLNGSSITNATIANCSFNNIGDDPNHIHHDHSSIYVHANKVLIKNNQFRSAGIDKPGARTAIETHGSDILVEGNQIFNYLKGMNITGVHEADSRNVTIRDNQVYNANYGLYLWSYKYRTHTSGYGFDGLCIQNNLITISQTRYANRPSSNAIVIDPGSDLPLRKLEITRNTIRFELEQKSRKVAPETFGIGYVTSKKAQLEDCTISGNAIENVPGCGIRFSCIVKGLNITKNIIINPGSTADKTLAEQFRVGINLDCNLVEKTIIQSNNIADKLPQARMIAGIYLGRSNTLARINVDNNYVTVADKNAHSFKGSILPPLLRP